MDWIRGFLLTESAGQSVFFLCLVAVVGLLIGRIKIGKIGVGVTGVLFAGLLLGHFGVHINHSVMDFAREGGLILFVYTIGLQLGPSFVSSLRQQGLKLNLLCALVVAIGVALVILLHLSIGLPMATGAGLYTGAVTNTPALGAAQEALRNFPDLAKGVADQPGLAYAMAYPGGVVGIIVSLLTLKLLLKVRLEKEEQQIREKEQSHQHPFEAVNIVVRNANLDGMQIKDVMAQSPSQATISRLAQGDSLTVALPESRLSLGDILLAVGRKQDLEKLRLLVGETSEIDLRAIPGPVTSSRVLVTRKDVSGRTLGELKLNAATGISVTRVERNGVELIPLQSLALQMGDQLTVVGEETDLHRVADQLGNSPKALQQFEIGPLFIGIALGVILGSIPVMLPGLPAAVKLGLAGGPLIVGMILSRIGRTGPVVWYMPASTNLLLREVGIVLFLACVGLKAGDRFLEILLQGPGLLWMACGALITVLPLILSGLVGRLVFKLNYLTLSGALAGSMTDPPALAFANGMTKSNGPSIAYATVYPLTMVLRIVSAQLLILFFGPG